MSLPAALECITISPMQDLCFAGASNGCIYVIDLSVTAIALSAAKASVGYVSKKQGGKVQCPVSKYCSIMRLIELIMMIK